MKTQLIRIASLLFLACQLALVSCTKQKVAPDNSTGSSSLREEKIKVFYGADTTRQVYDIYLPANRDTSTPIVLMIHGGGWQTGNKADLEGYVNIMRAKWKNVAIVNMNYRYASFAKQVHHQQIMDDIQRVFDDVQAKVNTYKISSKIAIAGASAGSQLAMIYAYRHNNKIKCIGNIFGPSIISDWSWYNSPSIIPGIFTGDVLSEYVGRTWDTTAYKAVSPYWNISSSSQPTISFHGNLDPVVPVYHSQWLHGKLRNLGVPSEYHEYIAFHGFDNTQSDDVITKMIAFFKIHLK
jgi:acetyl esterase/lipase